MQHDNMYQGTVGGPVLQHDGAVQTGRGKYRLQFLGSDNPKEITRNVVIAAVVVLLAIIVFATVLGGKQPKNPPYEVELRNAISQSLDEAALKVGVKTSEMTETEPGVYRSNKQIKLDGVIFDLYFYEEKGKLSGFAYIADYQADKKQAAKDICDTFINLGMTSFAPEGEEHTVEINLKYLKEELAKDQVLRIWRTSNLRTDIANDPVNMYMKELEESEDWEGRVGEYLVRKAELYLDEGCEYDPKTQNLKLVLSYRIEPLREQ